VAPSAQRLTGRAQQRSGSRSRRFAAASRRSARPSVTRPITRGEAGTVRLASAEAAWKGGQIMLSDCNAVPTIPTRDLSSSRRFYEDVLQLPIEHEDERMGVWYRMAGGLVLLYESEYAGTAKHRLMSFESDHIDEDIQQLRDGGVRFETYDLPGVEWDGDVAVMDGAKGVWFQDPAGNILGMFEKSMVLAHT
jgi:catechol 2,3-dioxygenase-like lactoylglutathione lyase family enzyme